MLCAALVYGGTMLCGMLCFLRRNAHNTRQGALDASPVGSGRAIVAVTGRTLFCFRQNPADVVRSIPPPVGLLGSYNCLRG